MGNIGWNLNKTLRLLFFTMVVSVLLITYAYLIETRCEFDIHTYKEMVLSLRFVYVVLFSGLATFLTLLLGANRLFKYRYCFAFALFALSVVLGISGSSIGMVTEWLNSSDSDVLYGVSRLIRLDEWAVFTPMTWSQYYGEEPFSYFSSIIRATPTDVFIEYGQPVRSFLMVFRPFQAGYLFLPFANGLAFFWMGRLIALFMVSFEFGRLFTGDNRRLSALYAVMVTFAPAVQWWFAINGFVEMLFFMQLSVVILNLFLHSQKTILKVVFAFIISICAGGYILTMYPAWMVPLAYILLAFIIWTFIKNKGTYKFKKADVLIAAVSLLLLSAAAICIYRLSHSTIDIISSTVYPGQRVDNGGGFFKQFFNTFTCLWYPLDEKYTYGNVCESAGFISLFPLGLLLYLLFVYRTKKNDALSVMLLIVFAFLGCYCFFGLPGIIAKITLVSHSTPNRALVILEFTDLLLLIRAIYLCENNDVRIPVWSSCCFALAITSFVTWMAYSINSGYFTNTTLIIQFTLMLALVGTTMIGLHDARIRSISSVLIIATMLTAGLLVNPIRIGVKSVERVPILQKVSETVSEDPEGTWIVEGVGYPYNNLLIMEGARTINSTNVYPDFERWQSIDDGDDDSGVYNRYAHIHMVYDNNPEDEFTLTFPDNYTVSVSDEELQQLGVDYIFSNRQFDESGLFQMIYSDGGFYIYRVSFESGD